jgi:osmotically-inducible protein OsmY
MTELAWEPSVTAAHIGVTASAGVVTLTGHVDSYAQKIAAERVARRVKGVMAVAEEIEVRLPFEHNRDDTEIAAAILERFSWDVSIPRDSIGVKVEKGWVTLTGQVRRYYEREAAEQEVYGLQGVVGVSNHMTIKPSISTATVSDDITRALHRSWFFSPENIKVSAEGGKIRLTGVVRSPYERSIAAETAWMAEGVTSVENDISVV